MLPEVRLSVFLSQFKIEFSVAVGLEGCVFYKWLRWLCIL